MDFEGEAFADGLVSSAELVIDRTATAPLNLTINNLPLDSTKPLFLALGIEFFQQVNNELYNLHNGAHNATALINVSGAP
ncbi:hypothetical protein [Chitinophaga sp. 22620]|uniref:hypothetical protein n=1 Tax=Chitinophaga sp. 22620 TaxID=3453952 RepID=UPI003F8544AD